MTQTIGVVPIFVNAGAAVLPAVLALASAAALLLKPRRINRHLPAQTAGSLPGGHSIDPWRSLAGIWLFWQFISRSSALPVVADNRAGLCRPIGPPSQWRSFVRKNSRNRWAFPPVCGHKTWRMATTPVCRSGLDVIFRRCGYDGGPVPLNLHLLWKHNQEDAWFLSSPAVRGGRVYCAFCQN